MSEGKYVFFADTGGTFTDCIAIDDNGEKFRTKVLSNGTIRGVIKRWIDGNSLQIEENWGIKKDILSGFTFRILKSSGDGVTVKKYSIKEKTLYLETEIPEKERVSNTGFELFSGDEAPVLGARLITETGINESVPVENVKLGSTKGTNALLERKGSRVLFVVTKGFEDILRIRDQQRPDIFARNVIKSDPLYHSVIGVDERTDSSGNIVKEPDREIFLNELKNKISFHDIESVAVALMHSYKNPKNEKIVKKILSEAGFKYISISSDLSRLIKYVPRSETTVVNSYLDKIINTYLNRMKKDYSGAPFFVMNSAGGLVKASEFKPKESLLSGPAGGVVGAVAVGESSGYGKLISFDMGGTSTDVSRYDGEYDYRFEHEVGDVKIVSPALAIETVAAGGGSICYYDGFKLCVGPESAGASPGPACYGAGGPLTITDVNLLSHRLDPTQFGIPVFIENAEKKLDELILEIKKRSGEKRDRQTILDGFLIIANEIMAGAIKKVSVLKGYDPSEYAMVAFGGAGGMHAIPIAELLNMSTVILPEDAGLLSAYGMSKAPVERIAEKQLLFPLNGSGEKLKKLFGNLVKDAVGKIKKDGIPEDDILIRSKFVYLRLKGQDSVIEVEFNDQEKIRKKFNDKYFNLYGYHNDRNDLEIESIRVIVSSVKEKNCTSEDVSGQYYPPPQKSIVGKDGSIPVYLREDLKSGAIVSGLALVLDKFSTWVVEDGWELKIDGSGSAIIKKKIKDKKYIKNSSAYNEIELELFTNRFMSIAENMGSMLQRVAVSVNVKERNDFSCALLDSEGKLVANAPHIPVHLGGLGVCVRKVIESVKLSPGDTVITNHPRFGGSHLPDITLITPVFTDDLILVGYVVNRAHHAEIGGKSPGSMPPDASVLTDEGVIIPPVKIVENGIPKWERIEKILTGAKFPTRALKENLADLNGAVAANMAGGSALLDLVDKFGVKTVIKYMEMLKNHATKKTEEALSLLKSDEYESEEYLDDGSVLKVRIIISSNKCKIDFSGSSSVHPGNMNSTEAIVNSVVIYVLRLLINEDIPLNDGILDPVELILPTCILNPDFSGNPDDLPAIVGGNIELSQRLTDTLLKPFGIVACSQGTMNNVLFGNNSFSYYETICGGCGAGPDFDGASAVHHHMTNTKITDPEIFEFRYPVRLKRFGIRTGSGGIGKHKGGDGVVREIEFLEPVSLSVLTQHRVVSPYGLNGGEKGKMGKQFIRTSGGNTIALGSVDGFEIEKGDIFVIYTPGGGGFGHR